MKNRINFSLITLSLIFSVISFPGFSFAGTENSSLTLKNTLNMANQYSWNAAPDAVSYLVEIVNTTTNERTNVETTDTFISLTALPIGAYDIIVKAKFADGSYTIIVEDMIVV